MGAPSGVKKRQSKRPLGCFHDKYQIVAMACNVQNAPRSGGPFSQCARLRGAAKVCDLKSEKGEKKMNRISMFKKSLLLAVLMSPALLAQALDFSVGELQIEHPWSREMPPSAPSAAAYFVVHNQGAAADRLLGVQTPVAGTAELHQVVHADGVMKMQRVQNVEIPASGAAKFAPMGYHVMLFNLKQSLRDGERFPLTLTFEKAGAVEVEVAVQKEPPVEEPMPQH
jgi:copper(I)-binding protein